MLLHTKDFPQADRFDSVIAATVAVANGATTDLDIANQIEGIQGDSRQGRYYRKAAEMLGFIRNDKNHATITERGQSVTNDPHPTNPIVLESVVNLNLYQKLLFQLENHPEGLTQQQIIDFLSSISSPEMGSSIIPRRVSTVLAWLRSLEVVNYNQNRYYIRQEAVTTIPIIEFKDIRQPIVIHDNLQAYQEASERISQADHVVTVYRNQAKAERSHNSHKRLVNLVASRIRNSGGIPKANQFIDLATTIDHDFIFEMKSTDASNLRTQIRKGISQLYEYRFLQNKPDARLVLVIESPLDGADEWYKEYIEQDRSIHLVWDGDDQLYGTPATRLSLDFLSLQ
jgi:hypothetical protein